MNPRRGAAQGGGWTDPEFAALGARTHERVGLVFTGTRIGAAEDAMRRTMRRLGTTSPTELRRRVESTAAARDVLLDELTVGESYFFREPRALEAVVRRMRELLSGREAVARRPVIWSAGCAAGEEPYSVAILLREAGLGGMVDVIGTDVSPGRLAAARRGRYTRWAFRGVPDATVERYFERHGSQYVLAPEIRRAVEFRAVNLVADELPSTASAVGTADVILCRNVMIYMDLATVGAVATRLLSALPPHGWLCLGAADPPLAGLAECESLVVNGLTVYRPTSGSDASPPDVRPASEIPASVWRPLRSRPDVHIPLGIAAEPAVARTADASVRSDDMVEPVRDARAPVATRRDARDARSAYDAGDYERAASLARAAIATRAARPGAGSAADAETRADDEANWVTLVRAFANLGELAAASEACVTALDEHRGSAELSYLYAVLLTQAGHFAAAAAAARRALYLDRSFVLAHLVLGEAFARAGDANRARRAFRTAVTLLERTPADALLMAAEGEPAARFLRIALDRLRVLEGDVEHEGGAA